MIIQCPECGHNVSDKAPMCPGCGVEIAGHIKRCPQCGHYYLDTENECPYCQEENEDKTPNSEEVPIVAQVFPVEENLAVVQPISEQEIVSPTPAPPTTDTSKKQQEIRPQNNTRQSSNKDSGKSTLIVSFIIAALICATMLYLYKDATDSNDEIREQMAQQDDARENIAEEAEDTPMQNYEDANQEAAETTANDEMNKQEMKTDSADWAQAKGVATKESYKRYMLLHPNGTFTTQAEEAIKKLSDSQLTQAESQKAFNSVRSFFIAINKKDREALASSVTPVLTSFDGKTAAQKSDVIQYMVNLYQADVKNLNWHLGNVTNIKKLTSGNERFEYEVVIPAKKVTERENITSTIEYVVKATVSPDGKISSMNMTRK